MISKTLFRGSLSSASYKSHTSRSDSTSDSTTPRTSIESNNDHEQALIQDAITTTQTVPILSLPIELLQHITSYLDIASAAPLCLSTRYIYYALGSAHLTSHINGSKSRFEKRRMIEGVVERAFPGHWFCAWCDVFHAWNATDTSPMSAIGGKKRDCSDFNSYLSASTSTITSTSTSIRNENGNGDQNAGGNGAYILRYHHIRLALNSYLWGAQHGIPLSTFSHSQAGMAKVYRTPVPTKLDISARISTFDEATFLLHTSWAIILPANLSTRKQILIHIWPVLPTILSGHRDSENGHTGLMAALDNVLRRGWKYPGTQSCSTCRTDWTVVSHFFPHASGGQVRLVVQSWRDLGAGRNPFDTSWRAHGGFVRGLERASCESSHSSNVRAGDIRHAFECAESNGGVTAGAGKKERNTSPARMRIYEKFMRRSGYGGEDISGDEVVRRSRARPRTWRTRSENEEVERREEEERAVVAREVAEEMVRLDAVRGMRG
ncbi:hypothetical protein EK21DRAFT_109809 [Setomelanomma holmii]|uniref:F-box domain-containing protein n=1 Tax=Setomelanomma holmii TaxID=210430 RepID=A0A9P4LP50_9PLEO|nr:hypothetical protein EK21DRAFT_109809 [Setomelanomma holmii]